MDGENFNHDKIRRISIDKFYELATGDEHAYKKICEWLPIVIFSLNKEKSLNDTSEIILEELKEIDKNFIDSVYKLSYPTYSGFDNLDIKLQQHLPNDI